MLGTLGSSRQSCEAYTPQETLSEGKQVLNPAVSSKRSATSDLLFYSINQRRPRCRPGADRGRAWRSYINWLPRWMLKRFFSTSWSQDCAGSRRLMFGRSPGSSGDSLPYEAIFHGDISLGLIYARYRQFRFLTCSLILF